MSARKRVLVSVLNYNLIDDAIVTLQQLRRQDFGDFDLELLDNASTTDAVARIRAALPNLTIVTSPVNNGYAGGYNTILRRGFAAGYEHVIACNNDLEMGPEVVRELVAVADAHPDAGVVGCIEEDFFTGRVRAVGGRGFSLWKLRSNWSTDVEAVRLRPVFDYVQGAMVLFTRRALAAGVALDERLFMYYEEADLGMQLRNYGLTAYVAQAARVRHKADARFLDLRSGYYQQRNRVYLVKKYGKTYHLWWHILQEMLFELPAKFLLRASSGHARYAIACAIGFAHGVAGRTGYWDGR